MATSFPTGLDNLVNPTAGDKEDVISHSAQHSNANDAIEALEAKVGVTNSAVTTSLDYRVAQVESKTVDSSATVKGVTKLSTAPVSALNPIALGENDTRVLTLAEKGYIPTTGQKDALTGTSGTPSSTNKYVTNDDTATSGANKVLRLDGTGKLPTLDGSNLTNVTSAQTLLPQYILSMGGQCMGVTQAALLNNNVYMYAVHQVASNASTIKSYKMLKGRPAQKSSVQIVVSTSNAPAGITTLGNFVFCSVFTGSSYLVRRFDKETLSNETAMTVSGITNQNSVIFSDGTDIYLCNTFGSSSYTMTRCTVSGTTLTATGTVYTYTGLSTSTPGSMYYDGSFLYLNGYRFNLTGGSIVASPTNLEQYSLTTDVLIGSLKQADGTFMEFSRPTASGGLVIGYNKETF